MKKDGCVFIPEILLPAAGVDMQKWAVIACDQHTSDPAYWETLEKFVGDAPSTLRLTLPEIYLSEKSCGARIRAVGKAMEEYLQKGILSHTGRGFVLVERETPFSPKRFGVVLAIDLEAYSFEKGAEAEVRATEATILERIPPRLKIRESASIEFPHVMLLYDDREDSVLGEYKRARGTLKKLYDFDLNMGGGHVRGYFLPEEEADKIAAAFSDNSRGGVVFMVGDGNHSLATAKAAWEKIKSSLSEEERKSHPARYALAEAVNLYDEGIRFEAIHRIVKGIDPEKFIGGFPSVHAGEAYLCVGGKKKFFPLGGNAADAVAAADAYIAAYIAENGGEVDYIHGEEALLRLTESRDAVGILLPKMDKSELFDTVKRFGALPRKTFSMGESAEKRYYIEGKEIVKR